MTEISRSESLKNKYCGNKVQERSRFLWKIYAIICPDVLLTVFVIETDGKLNEQQGEERRRVTKGDSCLQCREQEWFSHKKRKRDFPRAGGIGQTAIKRRTSSPPCCTFSSSSHWLVGQAHFSPLSTEDICQRAFQIQWWQDTGGQQALQP